MCPKSVYRCPIGPKIPLANKDIFVIANEVFEAFAGNVDDLTINNDENIHLAERSTI